MAETQAVANTIHVPEPETLVIKPSKGWTGLNLRDLWRYRELALFLTWRDIKVRYKQTLLGASWAIIQPLLQMFVFNFLFGNLAGISTNGVPRPIFTYSALLPWNLFSKALTDAGRSLVSNRNMITKVYFPRLLIPLSSILSGLVDFCIAFVVLVGMMIYYQFGAQPFRELTSEMLLAMPQEAIEILPSEYLEDLSPTVREQLTSRGVGSSLEPVELPETWISAAESQGINITTTAELTPEFIEGLIVDLTPNRQIWMLPFFIILALATALGVGLWLSAWNVHYRDVRYFIPFLTQFWLLASPIAYPLSEIPQKWHLLYSLNPMVGVVEGFRWALLGGENNPGIAIGISIGIAILLLVSGLFYFRRMERTFADTV